VPQRVKPLHLNGESNNMNKESFGGERAEADLPPVSLVNNMFLRINFEFKEAQISNKHFKSRL
jgi:hypothetical protein